MLFQRKQKHSSAERRGAGEGKGEREGEATERRGVGGEGDGEREGRGNQCLRVSLIAIHKVIGPYSQRRS